MNQSIGLLVLVSATALQTMACGGPASPIDAAVPDASRDATTEAAAPDASFDSAIDDSIAIDVGAADAADVLAADANDAGGADAASDAPDAGARLPSPPTCSTGARAPILAPGPCFVFTPAASATALGQPGAANGVNMDDPQFALGPDPVATDRHQLVVFIPATGSSPTAQIATPMVNFYNTAAHLGYHVLAVSYRNDHSINTDCAMVDACFFPSRLTTLTGVLQPGAAAALAGIVPTEGVYARIALALDYLVRADPHGGWGTFVQDAVAGSPPDARVRWSTVVAAGHSQGGGHAAAIGALQPILRAVLLSAVCDDAGGVPASWTRPTSAWRTDPSTAYWGLDVATVLDAMGRPMSGDTQCGQHAGSWTNLGMAAAHRNDAAATCGITGNEHGRSIGCADNEPNWEAMLR